MSANGSPALKVERVGVQAIFVDQGRSGFARIGVARAGPFDRAAWQAANEAVGNAIPAGQQSPGPAALEILLGPLTVTTLRKVTLCITGAPAEIHLEGDEEFQHGQPFELPEGQRLHIGRAKAGLRIYLAIQGGFAAEPTMGSRSYDTASKLGPPPIVKGQTLKTASQPELPKVIESLEWSTWSQVSELAANAGPDFDLIKSQISDFGAENWTVQPDSNRIGVRLKATHFQAGKTPATRPSSPTKPGTIQLLPSSDLVAFGPDCPTTGGYPVVAVLDQSGLNAIAQARPGTTFKIKVSQPEQSK